MEFNKGVKVVDNVVNYLDIPQEEMPHVTQFYRSDYDFVYDNGGEYYRAILNHIQNADQGLYWSDFRYISVDSRVSMLMKGWYPCIPGWHCDDFYRPGSDGQPDLAAVQRGEAPAVHYMMVVGDCSLTEFLRPTSLFSPTELTARYPGESPLYGKYDALINASKKYHESFNVEEKQIIRFSPLDFHRGVPATKSGWRLFVRLSLSNHHVPENQIRRQSQVYLTDPGKGW